MTIINCAIAIALVLAWAGLQRLVDIARHLESVSICSNEIRLQTEGLAQRLIDIDERLSEMQSDIYQMKGIASSYEDEVLNPIIQKRREMEMHLDLFGPS